MTCWGDGSRGQLPTGTDDQLEPTPALTLPAGGDGGPTSATAISAGLSHTCALLNTGDVSCWGANDSGQVGNDTTTNQTTPGLVTFPTATPTLALAAGQTSPTHDDTVNVTATFDRPVTLAASDITLGGSAGATTATPVNTHAGATAGTTWNIAITGMTADGTVEVSIPAGTLGAYGNTASNTVVIQRVTTGPVATIERAFGQDDTTIRTPIEFQISFDQDVTDFTLDDIVFTGTAGATPTDATLTGAGNSYELTINNVPQPGTVTIDIPAGAATDTADNPSTTTVISNTVTINDETPPVIDVPDDITVDTEPGATTATVTYTVTTTDPASTTPRPGDPSGLQAPANSALGIDAFGTTPITTTCDPASGTAFAVGTTTVTCTATDPSGNTTTGTFTVTVNAIAAPTTTTPPTTTTATTTTTTTTTPTPPTTAMPMPDPGIVLPATGNGTTSLQLTLMLALLATAIGTATALLARRR